MLFKVDKIINENTIMVSPKWSLNGISGDEVIVSGYEPIMATGEKTGWQSFISLFQKKSDPKINRLARVVVGNILSKKRLETLLLGKFVTLHNHPNETSDCIDKNNKAKLRVYLNNVDISNYFPDFKKT